MEHLDSEKQQSPEEELPSLLRVITTQEVDGFDSLKAVSEKIDEDGQSSQLPQTFSISMPSSPLRASLPGNNRDLLRDNDPTTKDVNNNDSGNSSPSFVTKYAKYYSQPMPAFSSSSSSSSAAFHDISRKINFQKLPEKHMKKNPAINKLKDKRYDSFKTWTGKFERQISHLVGKGGEDQPAAFPEQHVEMESVPVDRYFDALEGPELETLRASEKIMLPEDRTWPFLLRFPITSFGMCLGVSSQAIMWKTLAVSPATKFLHISLDINLFLWCISAVLVSIIASIYLLKLIFYFEAVRREYYHPVRVNFFFAPWIALLFLVLGIPSSISPDLHPVLWYILMTPIFCLELKIYGQWMSGGQRRLSKVANPSNHLSIVGNFVGALLGAQMGLKEGPIFFFAVGMAHYTVLFVTLYQRLPTNETLPKELHPVFFLFVAAPSVASTAWARIQGSFDYGCRIAYFIGLFLYISLAVRVNFFRGFKFSLSWWAYTFPMTASAIATVRYCTEVPNVVTKALAIILSGVASLTVTSVLVTTIIHAVVLKNLFPNDISIAISDMKPKAAKTWFHRRILSSDKSDIENYLKFADTESATTTKDIEACLDQTRSTTNEEEINAKRQHVRSVSGS
ncbi:S-type anion channel SLAH2 [Impatiens glandulifera]|uniref:S-type anion channel SLAH2 n=1 Tax=Impatiens glandulifera TaxID=253017 RepID=UPI001FB18A94|nr:S-type anion channel SLAH2 [Impatiens glandulifera]